MKRNKKISPDIGELYSEINRVAGLQSMQNKVKNFHIAFGLPIGKTPHALKGKEACVRAALIAEELAEYISACAAEDLIKQADALSDILYVVFGAAVASGIDIEKVFEEVHSSNMSKIGGTVNAAGKLEKPKTYKSPNLKKVLDGQINRNKR